MVLVDAFDEGGQGVDEALDASLAAVVGVSGQGAPRLVDNVPGEDSRVILVWQAVDAVDPATQQSNICQTKSAAHDLCLDVLR